jgi:hypothetical protein
MTDGSGSPDGTLFLDPADLGMVDDDSDDSMACSKDRREHGVNVQMFDDDSDDDIRCSQNRRVHGASYFRYSKCRYPCTLKT